MADNKQFAIYSRKSKFTGKGDSIENQIELCKRYITWNFGEEAAESALIYEDEGYSGGTLERPRFKNMMKDLEKKKINAIVVYRLDRISRSTGDFIKLFDDLTKRDIELVSISERFDTTNAMGRAMMLMSSVFSQLEREIITERIRDNMHELAKTGRWLGGTTPTGYSSESISHVDEHGKTRKACKLTLLPDEIQIVRTIFNKFLETGSLTKVDQFLLETGAMTKRNKKFTRFAIKAILANPVYLIADQTAYAYLTENKVELFSDEAEFDGVHGIMAYNRTLQEKGKATEYRPMSEWVVSVGKHEGVISGEKWVAAQRLLELNKSKSYRKPRSHVALLSGLLFCEHCGDYMRPKLTGRMNAQGELIYTYLCSTKEHSRSTRCKMKNANGNILDAKIIEEIKKLSVCDFDYSAQIAKAKKMIEANREGWDAEIAKVKKDIKENEASIKNLIAALAKASGTTAEKYILAQIDECHEQIEVLKKHQEELISANSVEMISDMEFDVIQQMLAMFSETVDAMNVEQKRAAIRSFVKRIVWDGENVNVYLFNSDDDAEFPDKMAEISDENGEPLCEDSE